MKSEEIQVNNIGMPFMRDNSEILAAIGVVGIIIIMLLPLPTMLLDLFISFNITISIIILLVSIYIIRPLDLSSFPSILLLATLFRLSLNIATTRIILLYGNEGTLAAGKVIKAFGNFVVGGNYIVGTVVFVVLVIVNLIVITKGSGRIGEVAARFNLDGMPGKQMSIDADLNAGLIDEFEAKARRKVISQEADFYGAMDGASKFVKGDAIAGIIITIINIIGGLAIGVFQNEMSISDAARTYTILTVGDGLVTQVPALIVSTAAGIVVSRAGSENRLGSTIASQILAQPRAIALASAVLFGLGLIPGLPSIPFIIMAIIGGTIAYFLIQAEKQNDLISDKKERVKDTDSKPHEAFDSLPPIDMLSLEVGYGLIPLVDVQQNGQLLDRIKMIRRQIAQEIGIIVPPIHIQDNIQLKSGEYSILLKGNEVGHGELMVNHFLSMDPGNADGIIEGTPTREPTFGLPAYWIKKEEKEDALTKGYTVVDLTTVLITHLSDIIKRNAHELLGRQDVQKLLDNIRVSYPKVVEELVPNLLPLGGVVRVLQNLLREQIPIRDLVTILEALGDWATITKDIDMLTENVRHSLARTITSLYLSPEGEIPIISLDQNIERSISESIIKTEQGAYLALDPNYAQKVMNSILNLIDKFSVINHQPIIICSAQIRSHFKKFIDRFMPNVVVLSYNDIVSNARIQSLGTVGCSNAD
jgi:flagellar biosynthesis protein FlhA